MLSRVINRGSPDRVFVVVRNSTANNMTVGHGVIFDYVNTTQQDGFNVAFLTEATSCMHFFAGIVVNKPIPAYSHGLVQCYGHCDTIWFKGAGTSVAMTDWDNDTLSANGQLILQAGTDTGYFETLAIAIATNEAIDQNEMGARYAPVLLGTTCPDGKTVNTDVTQTTVTVKGFIRAM